MTARAQPACHAIPHWIDIWDPAVGHGIGGYRVQGRIGRGGMGVVYLAHPLSNPERLLALKVLSRNSPEAVGRFKREILANSLFAHPNALEVYDAGRTSGGQHYLVMELFHGCDLATVLEAPVKPNPRAALSVIRQVLLALEAAHAAGIVHRDVKPANVLVSKDLAQTKLVDFGIALLQDLGGFEDRVFQTRAKGMVGTARYASPEQLIQAPVDGRSDLYSVGLLLYELLTGGSFPFQTHGPLGYLSAHLAEEPAPMWEVDPWTHFLPDELHDLVGRLLQKDPHDRPTSARAVVAEIDALPQVLAA